MSSSASSNLGFLKMHLVGVTLAALASLAAGASLKCLDTSLTILANNDLQGTWFDVYTPRPLTDPEQEHQAPTQTRP